MIKTFEEFKTDIKNEIDEDYILSKVKEKGYGDISPMRLEEFEDSKYFTGVSTINVYLNQFLTYLKAEARGF